MSESNTPEVEVATLEQTATTGDDVNRIAGAIESVLEGEDLRACMAALIALAILNMRQDLQDIDLGAAITKISAEIAMLPGPGVVDATVVEAAN